MNLIDENSDLYKRRLAKVIREALRTNRPIYFATFGVGGAPVGPRVNRARTRRNSSTRDYELEIRGESGYWIKLRPDNFANLVDDKGDQVVADRTPPTEWKPAEAVR